jgi:D-alanyl-lipoteichoic acid acyltransferase DltB (MBOAT superfamily)
VTFTSPLFFLFLPIVFLVFRAVTGRARWLVLLIASYGFYATLNSPALLVTLALVSLIGYAGGLWLGPAEEEEDRRRGRILGVCVVSCLGILFFTKYLPHFQVAKHYAFFNTLSSIGVSYYTFQAISYLIDVYTGVQEPESHLGYFALYLAYFPKLLQGPIERAHHLLPQLRAPYRFNSDNLRSGILLFAGGLFCKVVVAERLARYVNSVYDHVHDHAGLSLILATYCYAVQIYCDFAGYTHMARGTARILNIDLTENFNHPYVATSVTDFWRRWHISFSRWILDYIFKPLQLRWRAWGTPGTALALLVTFLASGIWHGASWGFVIWGLLHGIYLATSVFYRPYQKKLHAAMGVEKKTWYRFVQVFCIFNLVCFAWIFFRANNVRDAFYVVKHLATPSGWIPAAGLRAFLSSQILLGDQTRSSISLLLMLIVLLAGSREWLGDIQRRPALIRWPVYLALSYAIVMLGVWGSGAHFVYFAF